MKQKVTLTFCVLAAAIGLSCSKAPTKTGKFADCDQSTEASWAGKDICAQEHDQSHWSTAPVKIVPKQCKGIHITHTKDFRLDLLLYKENQSKSCPTQPFEAAFPVILGNGHARDFHTGRVVDRASDGCQYEIQLTELDNPQTCDPHVEIDGTP